MAGVSEGGVSKKYPMDDMIGFYNTSTMASMMDSFETTNGYVRIIDDTIQIESNFSSSIRRLFRQSKIVFIITFGPIVWALISLVIDHWLFPASLGWFILLIFFISLFFALSIIKLTVMLPTGITNAKQISVNSVDTVVFSDKRLRPTQVTIHYDDGDGTKKRQLKLSWGYTNGEIEASRRVFEVHGIDTDRT
ncbi:hypothetical protein [Halocatena marina]|uniref:hypothetical protein n=1 Tax=Halocatena marina TaxID=2934937 RepID=UPI00200D1E29|nr:hypothetical protein [Halocatena marina]